MEIRGYWKRLGNALLDRIEIRVPAKPITMGEMLGPSGESSAQAREKVRGAAALQRLRYRGQGFMWNSRLPSGKVAEFCPLAKESRRLLAQAVEKLSLSSRACHAVLRIARTLADLDGSEILEKPHLLEAVQHRRFGEDDPFWHYG
jgi:magnesium chelatase family protein